MPELMMHRGLAGFLAFVTITATLAACESERDRRARETREAEEAAAQTAAITEFGQARELDGLLAWLEAAGAENPEKMQQLRNICRVQTGANMEDRKSTRL